MFDFVGRLGRQVTPVETMEPIRIMQMTRVVKREETCCNSSIANRMPAKGALKPVPRASVHRNAKGETVALKDGKE